MTPELPYAPVGVLVKGYRWRSAASYLAMVVGLVLWRFGDTAGSLASIWWRSETYAHGLLVLPLVAYLLWQRRDKVRRLPPRAQPWAGVACIGAGALWAVGRLGAILSFEHFGVYFLLLGAVWLVIGTDALRRSAFPLGFAVCAVPFGDFLIPPLQEFTARFTLAGVQLVGVPIYREGFDLTLPSGSWRVEDVCSGLRYVIASAVLGLLYAHLTYRSRWRQAVFVAISLVVPVLANGLRAFGIVMIGHYSGMRLAVGVDHLIYGWIFFIVVMMALFAVGASWRENLPAGGVAPRAGGVVVPVALPSQSRGRALALILVGLPTLLVWPSLVTWLEARNVHGTPALLAPQVAGWQVSESPFSAWAPHFESPPALVAGSYRAGDGPVGLVIAYYNNQRQAGKLVSWRNQLVQRGTFAWGEIDHGVRSVRLPGGQTIGVREAVLHGGGPSVLVWTWYWTPQRSTASPALAKLLGTSGRLLGRGDDAAQVVLYVPIESQPDDAAQRLEHLITDAWPVIDRELAAAYRQAAAP